jgi:hypothetical protein
MIEEALSTTQREKESIRAKIEKLSHASLFLRKYFPFLGKIIIPLFINNRKYKLEEKIRKLRENEKTMQQRADLYGKVIIFFQDERTTVEDIHKVLVGLTQYIVDFSLKISAELFELKCNVDERNGALIKPIDQAVISFLKALQLIHA